MKKRTTAEQVIEVWNKSNDPEQAAKSLGMSRESLDSRISQLRGLDKTLAAHIKKFKRKTLKDRVPELIKIARQSLS